MVNYYVADDQYNTNNSHQPVDTQDDEIYRPDEVMSVEDWTSYYSDDLYNMWSMMRDYMEANGIKCYMMQDSDYSNFAEYCYSMSRGHAYQGRVGN